MGLDKNVASVFLSGGTCVSVHHSYFISGDSVIADISHAPLTPREWSTHLCVRSACVEMRWKVRTGRHHGRIACIHVQSPQWLNLTPMHENTCPDQQPRIRVSQPTEDPVTHHQMFVITQTARQQPGDLNRDIMLP